MERSWHARRVGGWSVLVTVVAGISLAGCGNPPPAAVGGGVTATSATESANSTDLAGRPSSPAAVRIVSPVPGTHVTGTIMHVVVALDGATITMKVDHNLIPTQGHVHLFVDGVMSSMAYGLTEDIPVHPGTFALQAEFVASDHGSFNPRVLTSEIVSVTG